MTVGVVCEHHIGPPPLVGPSTYNLYAVALLLLLQRTAVVLSGKFSSSAMTHENDTDTVTVTLTLTALYCRQTQPQPALYEVYFVCMQQQQMITTTCEPG